MTELWLAETAKKRDRLWARAEELLAKADAPPAEVRGILERRDVEALAWLVGRSA